MKILILASKFSPKIAEVFGLRADPFGGWLEGISINLSQRDDVTISYSVLEKGMHNKKVTHFEKIKYQHITYKNVKGLKEMLLSDEYDVYHIFGAEQDWAFDVACILDLSKTVVSIQGLISFCSFHYLANYNMYSKAYNLILPIYMKLNQNVFVKRGLKEVKVYEKARYCIGRTDWDYAAVKILNPRIEYFKVNEILRASFYSGEWTIKTCKRNTIFVSQAGYPLKAMHMILETLKLLKQTMPDVLCRIGGDDITKQTSLAIKLGVSYNNYIRKLIKSYGLENNVVFLGLLTEEEVKRTLLESHVFYCASSIENSSNSLAEAMYLGVPSVASYVGGSSCFGKHKESLYFYPFDEPYLAAHYIQEIMQNEEIANSLSLNARKEMKSKFDQKKNTGDLVKVYNKICKHNTQG